LLVSPSESKIICGQVRTGGSRGAGFYGG
jgi:hypothetical protein